jgi:hypothetical protein
LNADNYDALQRLIEASRRAGRLLELAPICLQRAEQAAASNDLALHFCNALFHLHTGRPEVAIKLFSATRRDRSLQVASLLRLIEICLHLDSGVLPSDAIGDSSSAGNTSAASSSTIETAEQFLSVILPFPLSFPSEPRLPVK